MSNRKTSGEFYQPHRNLKTGSYTERPMNVSTMLDITRSAPAPHLMRGHAQLLPDIALFSLVFYNPTKASLVATTRDHNLSIHSPVGIIPSDQ